MKKSAITILALTFFLTGCDQQPRADVAINTDTEQVIAASTEGDYQTIVPQPESAIRGVAEASSTSNIDLDAMETGLMEIAKEYASVEDYIYQPGSVVTASEAFDLISREKTPTQFNEVLKEDPTALNIGVNPIAQTEDDAKESKSYVNTIIEQDYFVYDDEGNKQIEKIAIGFGIDSTYEYKEGAEEVVISDDELLNYANPYIANRMTNFLRSKEGYEDVEIIYGFYKESENDLYPGTYYDQGQVGSNEDNLVNTKQINHEIVLFPTDEGESKDSYINDGVKTLESGVAAYFPYNVGTYAYGTFENNKLAELKINITVDVYSQIDLIPFVNYIEEQVADNLKVDSPITITVERTSNEAEAIINFDKDGNSSNYIY